MLTEDIERVVISQASLILPIQRSLDLLMLLILQRTMAFTAWINQLTPTLPGHQNGATIASYATHQIEYTQKPTLHGYPLRVFCCAQYSLLGMTGGLQSVPAEVQDFADINTFANYVETGSAGAA